MSENSRGLLQNDELPVDIFSIVRALLKDWWMILTAGLVGVICAFILADAAYTPVYTSSMTFLPEVRPVICQICLKPVVWQRPSVRF